MVLDPVTNQYVDLGDIELHDGIVLVAQKEKKALLGVRVGAVAGGGVSQYQYQ